MSVKYTLLVDTMCSFQKGFIEDVAALRRTQFS